MSGDDGEWFTLTDGTNLRVRTHGAADAVATLVLAHGWTQDNRTWERVLERLGTGVRALRYDLRGHGSSGHAGADTATIEQLADDLAELVTRRAPTGPVVLAGHSMGGMTIMALAARHPTLVAERVSGVAFVATAAGEMDRITLGMPGPAGNTAVRLERRLAGWLRGTRRDSLPLRAGLVRPGARWLVFGKRPSKRDVASVAEQLLCAHPASMGRFQDAIAAHEQRAALAVLRDIPGAVLVGDRDRLCPPRHARAIAARLPDAEFVCLPGAGHMLPQERPAEVARRLAGLVGANVRSF